MGISIRRAKDMGSVALTMPTGVVNPFAGATAPSGWLLCDGTEKAIASYPELYSLLTTIYGALTNGSGGAGSTHFRVPDLRGRTIAGKDDMGGSAASRLTATVLSAANTLGATGGTQTHTMTSAEMPSHTHTQDSHNHTQNAHSHTVTDPYSNIGEPNWVRFGTSGPLYDIDGNVRTLNSNSVTATNIATTATNQNTGGGGAHLNTQPTIVLNYIIKA